MVIVTFIALIIMPYANTSIKKEIDEVAQRLFFACMMLCLSGMLGVAATGDAFNLFVFLEISSLSSYVLVALGARNNPKALTAAFNYLVLGTIGATFFVIGIGMLYMATGTLNMADIAQRIQGLESNRTVQSAFAFIVVGVGLKIAIYPLHRWLPGAYTFAPSVVSAFLAATATKVAIYVIMRFFFSVWSPQFSFLKDTLETIILPVGIIAMFLGSLVAIYQRNIKRMLAYSSISQIGYMVVGIALINSTGLTATIVHLFNHAITKAAFFLAVGAILFQTGKNKIPDMTGIAKKMPVTAAAIVVASLSLIGIPTTAGFVSKWILINAIFEKGWWFVAIPIVVSSLLTVVYTWRIIEKIYFGEPKDDVREAPLSIIIPICILVVAILWFGINANSTTEIATTAAEALINGTYGNNATVTGEIGR